VKVEEYEHKLKMKKHLRIYSSEVTGHGNKPPFSSEATVNLVI
jgi:hypothetical protein